MHDLRDIKDLKQQYLHLHLDSPNIKINAHQH